MRLLLIEDEEAIVKPLKSGLERRNYAVDVALDGEQGFRLAKMNDYDCLILDLNLPKLDGLEVAKKLREMGNTVPILMLTARDLKKNIHEGFETGADDYLTKPFDFVELLYRINALIKRDNKQLALDLTVENIVLSQKNSLVTISGEIIPLNKKEFGILEYLLLHKGSVVTQEELLEHVWDTTIDGFSQTVRTNIKTLRKKVDPNKSIIKTLKGYGYIVN